MAKKPAPFNNPFAGLKLQPEAPKKAPPPAARSAPAPASPASKKARTVQEDEAELFLRSVGAVARVQKGPELPPSGGPNPEALAARIRTEDDDVLEHLALLVGGSGEFDLADSDEFIEGSITGLDRRIVRRLKAGEYAVQAHVDLHGMTRAEAKAALDKFIVDSRRLGRRCVLVVHGRGLHSKDQIPVLKQSVQLWLSQGRIGKEVIAFATARPADGGAGAVYVLLRR